MNTKKLIQIATAIYFNYIFMPAAQAGFLSRDLCRGYKSIVDDELYVTIGVIVLAILLIVWKVAPSGPILSKALGILIALALALNLENLAQLVFGRGLAC
jgi:hypothetical protein